ncbi:hypothetical protein C0J52_22889 [Blattella germanica]|nr:hypothetical protein C0J52_22889 [Blattella germanica]
MELQDPEIRTGSERCEESLNQCSTCFRTYKWRKALIRHQRYECGVKPRFTCYLCGHHFTRNHSLKTHFKAHLKQRHNSRNLFSDSRGVGGKQRLLLPRIQTITDLKSIINQGKNDIRELLSGSSGNGPPFPCHRCGRLYSHKCNLMRHLRLECGVGPRFACNWCDKKFKHRHHLRDHQRTHLHSQASQHSF